MGFFLRQFSRLPRFFRRQRNYTEAARVFPFKARPMRTTTDDQLRRLIQQCLAGETAAQWELIRRFEGAVFGLCFRMLGHRQDAEDVAQESLTRMIRSLHTWDATRDFEPWLLAITGNRCRTALSKRRSRVEELPEQLADRTPEQHDADQLAEELHGALAKVRDEYRQAFVLFHENELSYAEIAEMMGVPLGTIKTWVYRARREIITHLRERGVITEAKHELPRVCSPLE
jgi:RNA polymerase sigma-70 factor (ECF subfamily)